MKGEAKREVGKSEANYLSATYTTNSQNFTFAVDNTASYTTYLRCFNLFCLFVSFT